ncbi:MAG: hypothetical protein P4N24_09650 [Acidobacteriota bacterium]|nr:hypothetical protein [Acidobacteriota bacterium]
MSKNGAPVLEEALALPPKETDEQEDYLIAAQRLEESLPSIPLEKVLDDLNLRRPARPKSRR